MLFSTSSSLRGLSVHPANANAASMHSAAQNSEITLFFMPFYLSKCF